MDCVSYPDIHGWIQGVTHVSGWQRLFLFTGSTLQLCVSDSTGNLLTISFGINYDETCYWVSKPIERCCPIPTNMKLLHDKQFSSLLSNFIQDILSFCSNKNDFTIDLSKLNPASSDFKEIFNLCFFVVSFVFLAKKQHKDLDNFISGLKINQLSSQLTEASRKLMQILDFNLKVEWMRSLNTACAYWNQLFPPFKTPLCPISCSFSTNRFWKVQLFCPIMAMNRDSFDNDKFLPSLSKYQAEGIFQLHYRVVVQEDWIDVVVNVDNIRIDVLPSIQDEELKTLEIEEKHFPSRVLLNLTPIHEINVMSVSISQSSDNPTTQLGLQKSAETSFQSSQPFVGLKVAAGEAMSTNLKPWKFEESANRNGAIFDWILHDVEDGKKEVHSSKLPKKSLINPQAWFRSRYSSANSPFVKQGGVIFARDIYGQPIEWKIYKNAIQNTTKWKLKGKIWLTYWPNKHKISYYETRSIEFEEILDLTIP